jgi:hypothetical protein
MALTAGMPFLGDSVEAATLSNNAVTPVAWHVAHHLYDLQPHSLALRLDSD